MPAALTRFREAVRREGAVGIARRGAHSVFLEEEHIWHALDLTGDRPRTPLPDGFELQIAEADDAESVARLPGQPRVDEIHHRVAGSADVYVVAEDGRIAFACTIFRGRTPVVAARGGWLDMPDDTACLEDSSAPPQQELAAAAWSAVADALAERRFKTLLTKALIDDTITRRALLNAGFGEVADVQMRRIGPFKRVALSPLGAPGAEFLIALLSG